MASVSANDLTRTHFCKAPGCENEARSPVGRYAYCPEHQGTTAARQATGGGSTSGSGSGTEAALRDLLSLAKKVDTAKAKAEKAQRTANEASRSANAVEREYKDALAEAARGAARAA